MGSFEFKGAGFAIGGANATPDPLADVEYTGDLRQDADQEFKALESAYVQRRKAEDKRRVNATDSEYWFAVCFESRAEKEAFLRAVKAKKSMHGDKYLNGRDFARLLGVEF